MISPSILFQIDVPGLCSFFASEKMIYLKIVAGELGGGPTSWIIRIRVQRRIARAGVDTDVWDDSSGESDIQVHVRQSINPP